MSCARQDKLNAKKLPMLSFTPSFSSSMGLSGYLRDAITSYGLIAIVITTCYISIQNGKWWNDIDRNYQPKKSSDQKTNGRHPK
jgi:hypothetical protein